MQNGTRDAQDARRLTNRHRQSALHVSSSQTCPWTTQAFARRTNASQTSLHSLLNPPSLKLRQRRQDMKLELPRRRRAVDPLAHRNKRHTQCLEVIEERHQMAEIPTEAIQSPAHDDVELSAFGIRDHLVERRPTILRAAEATIHKLDRRPSSRLNIAAEFLELVLRFLIEGGNAGVDRSFHLQELITTGSAVQLPTLEVRKAPPRTTIATRKC